MYFQICNKGFVHKFYLTEHMDYHSGKKNNHKTNLKYNTVNIHTLRWSQVSMFDVWEKVFIFVCFE